MIALRTHVEKRTLAAVTMPSLTGSSGLTLTLEADERDGLIVRFDDETRGLLKFVRADAFFSGVLNLTTAWRDHNPRAEVEGT